MTIAPHVVIVADHTKLGVVSTVFLAPINAAHLIITDQAAPPDIVTELQELGVEVLVV
jgi:DeoR family transcriptional regulator of aga operon